MKKRCLVIALVASAVIMQSFYAFGAGSSSSDDEEPEYETNKPVDTVTVNSDGVKTTETVTSTTRTGSTLAIAVEATTPSGKAISVNDRGEAVVGDTAIAFAKGDAATAGLPETVVNSINGINDGKNLNEVVSNLDLKGYNALTGTHAIVTKDAVTGNVKDIPTEVALYVPNLVGDLGEVSILYYDNATGQWILLPVSRMDMQSKLVYTNVTGSGTLSVVYKK